MNKLSDLAIQRIIDDYPDDVLRQFKKQIEDKLRKKNQYVIVIGLNLRFFGFSLLRNHIKKDKFMLMIKFLLNTIDHFFTDFIPLSEKEQESFSIEWRRVEDPSLFVDLMNDLHKITSYKDLLEYLLLNNCSEYALIMIFKYMILNKINYGFNKDTSLIIYEYYKNFIEKYPDCTKIINTFIVNEGDYISYDRFTYCVISNIKDKPHWMKHIYQV